MRNCIMSLLVVVTLSMLLPIDASNMRDILGSFLPTVPPSEGGPIIPTHVPETPEPVTYVPAYGASQNETEYDPQGLLEQSPGGATDYCFGETRLPKTHYSVLRADAIANCPCPKGKQPVVCIAVNIPGHPKEVLVSELCTCA